MSKKINNPDGKKGGEEHQRTVEEQIIVLAAEYAEQEVCIRSEVLISTPLGKKSYRIADLAVFRLLNCVVDFLKIVQIGKTDKNGAPVKREKEAIDDIEAHTNIKVTFVDYKSKKRIK